MTETALQPAEYAKRVMAAAENYRIAECERLLGEARERLSPDALVRDVCSPVLHEAGDRWEKGRFSVVQEHLLTSAVRRQLTHALDLHNGLLAPEPCVVFTTLSGERHEIGSLMLAVLAASRGVRAVWLGPDLPVAEVGRFCAHVRVAAVAISIVTSPGVIDAARQLADLRAALPAPIGIWLGGQAAMRIGAEQLPTGTVLVLDLDDFGRRLAATLNPGRST